MTKNLITRLGDELLPAVLEAGRIEMRYFSGGVTIEKKADSSPVTAADREAETIILAALAALAPGIPVIAEEQAAAGTLPEHGEEFFLVDALDGTRLFVSGKPEFSVNIGLIQSGRPVFGLIYVPPTGDLYLTRDGGRSQSAVIAPDAGAAALAGLSFHTLRARSADPAHLVAFNSRHAGGAATPFLSALNVKDARPLGSSLKFCKIAAGEGDLYARFGETYEWDTAAGQAILEAAGGSVTTADGSPLSYGHRDRGYRNPHFVAWGRNGLKTDFEPVHQAPARR
jgi:3'(2'), 5'-bisphosphate nucleotidase